MGTRADYYIGRGLDAEWIGSTGYDGCPTGLPKDYDLLNCKTEQEFRSKIETMKAGESSFTSPEQGWPWPWDDSKISEYAYAFDNGEVYYTVGDNRWWKASDGEPTEEDRDREDLPAAVFPDMSSRKNVTMGQRSGLMIFHRS